MLTVKGVSERGQISEDVVRSLIANGKLVAYKIGRCVRIYEEDWEAYLRRNTVVPRPIAANDNKAPKSHARAMAKLSEMLGGI